MIFATVASYSTCNVWREMVPQNQNNLKLMVP